jgi:DNA-binding response OmpR family regulator
MAKILVADDDFAQRDLYAELFRQHGFEVTVADDGQDAWEKLEKGHFDLLFTGILMPRLDGFSLLKKIRSHPNTNTMPVVVFSHLGREEDRVKASGFPRTDFVVKGYDSPVEILQKVKALTTSGGAKGSRVE